MDLSFLGRSGPGRSSLGSSGLARILGRCGMGRPGQGRFGLDSSGLGRFDQGRTKSTVLTWDCLQTSHYTFSFKKDKYLFIYYFFACFITVFF